MSISPWPGNSTNSVLFLLDAAHRVEEEYLEAWLEGDRIRQSFSGNVERIVVPIAGAPERIPAQNLAPVLQLPADTLVVPVRVVWLKALDVKNTTPRIRDLLFGNPRHPGPAKARRILRRHPRRAKCISGTPATLAELRERLRHRLGRQGRCEPSTQRLSKKNAFRGRRFEVH